MPRIQYQNINFSADRLALIERCNTIISEYIADGLQLTLRQLYYQLVARGIIRNKVQEYKRLGDIVNNARLAGLIDWDAIEDRTRNLKSLGHWTTPAEIVAACATQFRIDKWNAQTTRAEVWIEKEALAGVFDRICTTLDVPYFACRGYTSQSEMWAAAQRFISYLRGAASRKGISQGVTVFHFGDHDPSGIDMTRDIQDRIRMFVAHHVGSSSAARVRIIRLALNMDQVEQYRPPENPAKTTDSRFKAYEEQFGESSWELDALEPRVLAALVRENILSVRQGAPWDSACAQEAMHRALLAVVSDRWGDITDDMKNRFDDDIEAHYQTQYAASKDRDGEEQDGE